MKKSIFQSFKTHVTPWKIVERFLNFSCHWIQKISPVQTCLDDYKEDWSYLTLLTKFY